MHQTDVQRDGPNTRAFTHAFPDRVTVNRERSERLQHATNQSIADGGSRNSAQVQPLSHSEFMAHELDAWKHDAPAE